MFLVKNKHPVCILGAGPCGLGAAWRFQETGFKNYFVFEQSDHAGGLAASITDAKGYTWDIGSHVTHSHYEYFNKVFRHTMNHAFIKHTRSAWIWQYDTFIPYPFQYNLHYLPKNIQDECMQDFINKKTVKEKPTNYHDWLMTSFGRGIAKYFQIPYNHKVWAYPLEKMNTSWVGDRVAVIDKDSIVHGIQQKNDNSEWGPNYKFIYPASGGNGDIWNRVAKKCKDYIHYNKSVAHVDTENKILYFSDHTTQRYSYLLSTIPLDTLVTKIVNRPASRTTPLHASSLFIVGLGVKGDTPKILKDKMWVYFATDEFLFFRAAFLKTFSKNMAPHNQWSIMCEVSYSKHHPLPKGNIAVMIVQSLHQHGFIDEKNVVDQWSYTVDRGYPTPTVERDAYIIKLFSQLEPLNIYSRGRFGLWKYEVSNQDHSFMQGVEWVNKMLFHKSEITAFNPNRVNKLNE